MTMMLMYPPPQLRPRPAGVPVPFEALCRKAGMRVIVSTSAPPDVRVHGEAVDFKAVAPGRVAYCLGLPLLSGDARAKARAILHKLAYQFHDWAAREVVAFDRREALRRMPEKLDALRGAMAPTPARVLAHLRRSGRLNIGQIAEDLKLAQPHVSRAVRTLAAAGLVRDRKLGREVMVELQRDRESAIETLMTPSA